LDHIQATAGFLFSSKYGTPTLVAPVHGEEPPAALLARVSSELNGDAETDDQTVASSGEESGAPPAPDSQRSTQSLYVVHLLANGTRTLGALAALQPEGRPLRRPRPAFFGAVASALFQTIETGSASRAEAHRA
jgi:hypothetical protein